jgi:membrane peptidoglycan carboxypeptidase
MASAYGTLANEGVYAEPYVVSRVTDLLDREVFAAKPHPVRALDPEVANEAAGVLRDVVERGTGKRARALGRPAGGKTGTTDEYRDAWFAGFTKQLSAAVWLGYSPVSKPMDGIHGLRHVFGGSLPAEIWLRTMRRALAGEPVLDLPKVVRDREPSPAATIVATPSVEPQPTSDVPRRCRRYPERCRPG